MAYLYLLPAFLVYAAFLLYPLVRAVQLSFYRWDGLTLGTWVGLDNYLEVVHGPGLRAAFSHALVLMVFYALVPLVVGLGLAVDPQPGQGPRARLLPHGGVPAAGGGDGRRRRGVASHLRPRRHPQRPAVARSGLGSLTRGWLGDYTLALPAVGFIGTWFETGLVTVLLLAGMGRISGELYEAARLDGAGPVREFLAVTLPSVRGEIAVALTLTVIAALRTFDLVYVTTAWRPRATARPCRRTRSTTGPSSSARSAPPPRSASA